MYLLEEHYQEGRSSHKDGVKWTGLLPLDGKKDDEKYSILFTSSEPMRIMVSIRRTGSVHKGYMWVQVQEGVHVLCSNVSLLFLSLSSPLTPPPPLTPPHLLPPPPTALTCICKYVLLLKT